MEQITIDLSNRLFEAGCDDSNPSSSRGRSKIAFDRQATTLSEAIRTAVSDVRKTGLEVDHVEIENVDLAETKLAQWSRP